MAKPATVKPVQPALDRQATATLGPVFTLSLDQIVLQPEVYRHRKATDLEAKKVALKELCDNLIVEGQRDPLVVYQDDAPTDPARPYILIAGHRRHAAMQILADKNTPNFTRDMQVTARAIEGGTKADYLLLSVSDNLFHEPLDSQHRTFAAVSLLKAGLRDTRIKINLRLSDSAFARCKRLYESPWMIEHVGSDNLSLSDAHSLLEAAGGQGGAGALEHLKQDLETIFTEIREAIKVKQQEKAEQGKELKGPALKVKTYIQKHQMNSWVLALKQGKRLRAQAQYKYGASIVQEKLGKRLYVPSLSVPLVDGELDRLKEITIKLDKVVKQLRPVLLGLAQARANAAAAIDGEDGASDSKAAGLGEMDEILESLRRRESIGSAGNGNPAAGPDAGCWSGEEKERALNKVHDGEEIESEQPIDEE